jgi:regulator of sigma E protease
MNVIYFILILGIIVMFHELGHMLSAKLFGVYVREFSIGFGPKLWSRKGRETVYAVRAVPLGGYTAMVEEETTPLAYDDQNRPTEILTVPKERTFYGVAVWKRILILLAGPLFNLLLACLVFTLAFQINGFVNEYPEPVIATVQENSPAQQAGIVAGDRIVKMVFSDGRTVEPETFYDVIAADQNNTEAVTLYLQRGADTLMVTVTPQYDSQSQRYLMGITCGEMVRKELNFFTAIPEGFSYAFEVLDLTVTSVIGLFTGASKLDSLGGTISIYRYTAEAAQYGLVSLLSLCASLSISVGVMNLIPIPLFDGGRILVSLIEWIRGRRISQKAEAAITYVGLALIVLLFLFVTYQDITKLVS